MDNILKAKRRINHLKNILDSSNSNKIRLIGIYLTSSNNKEDYNKIDYFDKNTLPKKIIINDVQIDLQEPLNPQNIPFTFYKKFFVDDNTQEMLQHLRWMIQKDLLGQDMYLLGPPGSLKRWIAFRFCEITLREAQYICLTPDVTENDLKSSREIRNGSLVYIDTPTISASINGQVLILEGIEKCERGVITILNNLLENREMQLEDGRFLTNPERYQQLISEEGIDKLDNLKLVPVSNRFRVIALGVPVPKFNGNPLDPPFRSRFSCRNISFPSVSSQLHCYHKLAPNLDINILRKLISIGEAIRTIENGAFTNQSLVNPLPYFPEKSLLYVAKYLNQFEKFGEKEVFPFSICEILKIVYPYHLISSNIEQETIESGLEKLGLFNKENEKKFNKIQIIWIKMKNSSQIIGEIKIGDISKIIDVNSCYLPQQKLEIEKFLENYHKENKNFYIFDYHKQLISDLLIDMLIGSDVCLVGEKGEGKSLFIRMFAKMLGYDENNLYILHLYKDMTSRDLFQRRVTKPNGDTDWQKTSIINAALKGGLLILEGIDLVRTEVLSVLNTLLEDRECTLFDGSKLLRWDKYDHILFKKGKQFMIKEKLLRISESFRVITTCCPPQNLTNKKNWLSPEVISLFSFHYLNPVNNYQKKEVALSLFPQIKHDILDKFCNFQNKMKEFCDEQKNITSKSLYPFSLRQFLRICKRIEKYPDDLFICIHSAYVSSFLPSFVRESINNIILESNINPIENDQDYEIKINKEDKILSIGNVESKIYQPKNYSLVPNILFFEIPKHNILLREILKDFLLKENLLLIGNQGVGKNKLIDKLLQMLEKERHYIQLHRDTTVSSIISSPSLINGKIVWEDSPLILAVKYGRILIIDEADKAPPETLSSLKGLIEDRQMILPNGTKLLPKREGGNKDDTIIEIHPEFQIILLANRPGFPFLGNNFYSEIGDIFSQHIIDSPDVLSETLLLKKYAPNVSDNLIRRLSIMFSDLRELVNNGVLNYPLSTRELVNIVKHLEKFPGDSVVDAMNNVFSFDMFDRQLIEQLAKVFNQHGFPFHKTIDFSIILAKENKLNNLFSSQYWNLFNGDEFSNIISKNQYFLQNKKPWKYIMKHNFEIKGRTEWRIKEFGELKFSWNSVIKGNAKGISLIEDNLYVLTHNPTELHCYNENLLEYKVFDIESHIPIYYSSRINPHLIKLPNSKRLIIFIPVYDIIILFDTTNKIIQPISFPQKEKNFHVYNEKIYFEKYLYKQKNNQFSSCYIYEDLCQYEIIILFDNSTLNNQITILDFREINNSCNVTTLDINVPKDISDTKIRSIFFVSMNFWILQMEDTSKFSLILDCNSSQENFRIISLKKIVSINDTDSWQIKNNRNLIPKNLNFLFNNQDQTIVTTNETLFNIMTEPLSKLVQFNPMSTILMTCVRKSDEESIQSEEQTLQSFFLQKTNQMINVRKKNIKEEEYELYLEIINFDRQTLRKLKMINPVFYNNPNLIISIQEHTNGNCFVMQKDGLISYFQLDPFMLEKELHEWRQIIGQNNQKMLSLITEYENNNSEESIDINNENEGEGNGEGNGEGEGKSKENSDNKNKKGNGNNGNEGEGMGGQLGIRRVDTGMPVDEISEKERIEIHEDILKAQKEMAQKTLQKKLEEIELSQFEASQYENYLKEVESQINQLKFVLDGVESREKERTWLKRKNEGEIDEMRLVENVLGEKNVYKKRGKDENKSSMFQKEKKRILFVFDVSASMYRFNNEDGRLDRLLSIFLLIVHSFNSKHEKYEYAIYGHSGDSPSICFVPFNNPPKNSKQIFQIMKKIQAHTEYCSSGDKTVEAIDLGIDLVFEREADDYFCFVLSDANLKRYNISTKKISEIMQKNEKVNTSIIFISSGNEAEEIKKFLPLGKSHICENTKNLPLIIKQIFTDQMLRDL